jgi:hypothetical protein
MRSCLGLMFGASAPHETPEIKRPSHAGVELVNSDFKRGPDINYAIYSLEHFARNFLLDMLRQLCCFVHRQFECLGRHVSEYTTKSCCKRVHVTGL